MTKGSRRYLATCLAVAVITGLVGMASANAAPKVTKYIDAGSTGPAVKIGNTTWEPQTGFAGGAASNIVVGQTSGGPPPVVAKTALTGAYTFQINGPNGRYSVTLWFVNSKTDVTISAEGKKQAVIHPAQAAQLRTVAVNANVLDGVLNLAFTPAGNALQIAALVIQATPTSTAVKTTAPAATAPMNMPGMTMNAFMNAGGPPNRNFDVSTADEPGEFQMECGLAKQAKDDPIMFPGAAGASHMHNFYGNVSTNASSTTASLLASKSDCARGMDNTDHSAYWVPALIKKDGSAAKSNDFVLWAYYRRGGVGNGPLIQQTFPNGIHMIAGDHSATTPQPKGVTQWQCGFGGGYFDHLPNCNTEGNGDELHAIIPFPNCWNGKDLDTPTHTGHVAYSAYNGTCPAGFPVVLPSLWYDVDYVGVTDGSQYTLASGGKYSMHGDFIAAWDLHAQKALIDGCLNHPHVCEDVNRQGNTIVPGDHSKVPSIDISKY